LGFIDLVFYHHIYEPPIPLHLVHHHEPVPPIVPFNYFIIFFVPVVGVTEKKTQTKFVFLLKYAGAKRVVGQGEMGFSYNPTTGKRCRRGLKGKCRSPESG